MAEAAAFVVALVVAGFLAAVFVVLVALVSLVAAGVLAVELFVAKAAAFVVALVVAGFFAATFFVVRPAVVSTAAAFPVAAFGPTAAFSVDLCRVTAPLAGALADPPNAFTAVRARTGWPPGTTAAASVVERPPSELDTDERNNRPTPR